MRHPIFVRDLTEEERAALEHGLRSSDAFVLRRCQILLTSAQGVRAPQIARQLNWNNQTVLSTLHAFNATGLAALTEGSCRPKRTRLTVSPAQDEQVRAAAPESAYLWQAGERVDARRVGRGQLRAGGDLHPAQPGHPSARTQMLRHPLEASQAVDCQPQPGIHPKTSRRDRLIHLGEHHADWGLGFEDEVW